MKLRDHPLMSYRGIPNWPPLWTYPLPPKKHNSARSLRGEVGVLKYVHSNSLMSNKCFLVIDFQEETYIGSLLCKDDIFCAQISKLLRYHVGCPIKDIATWTCRNQHRHDGARHPTCAYELNATQDFNPLSAKKLFPVTDWTASPATSISAEKNSYRL